MEKIYILFETPANIPEEDVKAFGALRYRFCELVTYGEVTRKEKDLSNCKGILDCTSDFKIYNAILKRKEGREFKTAEGESYIHTARGNFVMKGVTISQLMCAEYNRNLQDDQDKAIEKYISKVRQLLMLIPKIANRLKFEEGFKSLEGIDVSDAIGGNKKYVLVKQLPEFKEANVEYITPDDIKLLVDLIKVGEFIK
ncbi:MAG: hypothetical protein ACRCTZ_14995 [Sarcina sp.]